MNGEPGILPKFRLQTDPHTLKGWRSHFLRQEILSCKKGDIIIKQGTLTPYLYYVVEGYVEYVYRGEDESETLINVLGKDTIINVQPFFGNVKISGTFRALNDCRISRISRDAANELIDTDKQLSKELLVEMSKIVEGLVRQLYSQSSDSAEMRVVYILCLLAEEYPKKKNRIQINLSQEDLARIARTTRVTITKIISDLKKQGLVSTTYGGIIVEDPAALRQLTEHS